MRYISAIIFSSLAAALIVMYAYPTWKEVDGLKQRQVELQDYVKKAGDAQAKINILDEKYKQFPKGASDRMAVMIPETVDDIRLTMDLAALAGVHGLSLANPTIKKLAVDKNSQLQQYSVSFSIEAPYNTFREFLKDTEYWLQLRDITALSLSAGANPAVPIRVSFEFTTYALH